jgi:hypothetical protein
VSLAKSYIGSKFGFSFVTMARRPNSQLRPDGYALLLMMFFVALVGIAVAATIPDVLTQGRREKEEELIWRGNQYARAIRLYYQKTHRLPITIEEMSQAKTGIRFLRQAYKDPMNKVDGSWRLISVGPNGEYLGSLKPNRNAYFFGSGTQGVLGGVLSSQGSGAAGNTVLAGPGQKQNSSQGLPSWATTESSSTTSPVPDPGEINPAPLQAKIVGVGSKINRTSIIKYEGSTNYLQFEFVWDGNSAPTGSPSY